MSLRSLHLCFVLSLHGHPRESGCRAARNAHAQFSPLHLPYSAMLDGACPCLPGHLPEASSSLQCAIDEEVWMVMISRHCIVLLSLWDLGPVWQSWFPGVSHHMQPWSGPGWLLKSHEIYLRDPGIFGFRGIINSNSALESDERRRIVCPSEWPACGPVYPYTRDWTVQGALKRVIQHVQLQFTFALLTSGIRTFSPVWT